MNVISAWDPGCAAETLGQEVQLQSQLVLKQFEYILAPQTCTA